jgi:hypothetical protein
LLGLAENLPKPNGFTSEFTKSVGCPTERTVLLRRSLSGLFLSMNSQFQRIALEISLIRMIKIFAANLIHWGFLDAF